ncbi:MAG: MBL fold metallo-hydrolase [Pseudomonadota bacterium]
MGGTLRITVLGCGSSGGVPRIGPDGPLWGNCDPANPLNRRRRCAILVERRGAKGTTSVLIDAGPDMREQLIASGAGRLDAVVFTHDHADHCHGIDDLRMVVINRRARLPAYMDAATERSLRHRFSYVFETPPGSSYPPILEILPIDGTLSIPGPGGPVVLRPFSVPHGRARALGFRIGPLAYAPDISAMTDEAWDAVAGADIWLLDALRWRPHESHANVEQAVAWILQAGTPRAYLTNLHTDLDYAQLDAGTPGHITPAHDGLTFEFPLAEDDGAHGRADGATTGASAA